MAVTLGTFDFDGKHTRVEEKHEEVAGSDARIIEVSGLIVGESSEVDIHAKLDAILEAASEDGAELSVRPGRRLRVRRAAFTRTVPEGALTGAFTLTLEALDPYEESTAETSGPWVVTASGDTLAVTTSGNTDALPVITVTATGDLVKPTVSDGARSIMYDGMVPAGSALVLDAREGTATLDGSDVTPYTSGLFPRIAPGGTTLTYTDDASSSHSVSVTVAYRDRWW